MGTSNINAVSRWLDPSAVQIDAHTITASGVTLKLGDSEGLEVIWNYEVRHSLAY